jgi:putative thioredoxin
LALAGKTAPSDLGDAAEFLAALDKNANDHQARFDLALAHHGGGRRESALDELLEIVARQRDWNEDAARKQLLELFDAYGAQDELVVAARKRLSSLLFS